MVAINILYKFYLLYPYYHPVMKTWIVIYFSNQSADLQDQTLNKTYSMYSIEKKICYSFTLYDLKIVRIYLTRFPACFKETNVGARNMVQL